MTEADVPSPCTNVCKIDPLSGWCLGCARSLDEIMVWSKASPDQKLAIWRKLPPRFQALGLPNRAMPEELG